MSQHPAPPAPVASVSMVVLREGCVLLARRARPPYAGSWSLPGGKVEPGEPVRAAAAREVLEETGITVRLDALVDVVDVIGEDAGIGPFHFVLNVFRGSWRSGDIAPAGDCAEARWVKLSKIAEYALVDGNAAAIAKAVAARNGR